MDNDKGEHEDLLFSLLYLIADMEFDTYYFAITVETAETIDDIKNAVSQLIQF